MQMETCFSGHKQILARNFGPEMAMISAKRIVKKIIREQDGVIFTRQYRLKSTVFVSTIVDC